MVHEEVLRGEKTRLVSAAICSTVDFVTVLAGLWPPFGEDDRVGTEERRVRAASQMARYKNLMLLVLWLYLASDARAQFEQLVSPRQASQAQSAQELDEYIDIVEAPSAVEKIKLVDAFAQHYPASQLLGDAYQHQMLAYRELNDYNGVIRSGETALKLSPDNLNTLLTLANVLPNGVPAGAGQDPRLEQAEGYAMLVFQGIERMKLPRSVSPQRWQELRLEMEASAHEALGHVASKRGKVQQAISEFEKAVQQNPAPQGSQFYRLGVAYMMAHRYDSATEALNRAAQLGPDEIRKMVVTVKQGMKTDGR